jgi:hypothetical protein
MVAIATIATHDSARWRAENGRARADQHRTWRTRTNYRDQPK